MQLMMADTRALSIKYPRASSFWYNNFKSDIFTSELHSHCTKWLHVTGWQWLTQSTQHQIPSRLVVLTQYFQKRYFQQWALQSYYNMTSHWLIMADTRALSIKYPHASLFWYNIFRSELYSHCTKWLHVTGWQWLTQEHSASNTLAPHRSSKNSQNSAVQVILPVTLVGYTTFENSVADTRALSIETPFALSFWPKKSQDILTVI